MATAVFTPERLGGMELFFDLPPAALADVGGRARVRHLARGTIVFSQGQPADRCHALLAGRVRIAQSGEDGGQLLVRFVGPGEMFGTMALFTDRHYPADATAVVDSVEISWTEGALLELIQHHPQIAINLVKIVGARLREVQERLRELATQRVEQRMAHLLLRLADQRGVADGDSTTIDVPLTRQDLADMCGTTLYSASRILRTWERAGLLKTSRQRLTLRNLPELRRLAGEQPARQPS
jgi:CRP/FNR family transcriptional regulator, nitrogen oxide reductase regulator